MRFELDFLDGCLAVLRGLRQGASPTSLISPLPGGSSVSLNLRTITTEAFAEAVRDRPLATDVQDALISLYERALQRLKTTFAQGFTEAQSRWGASRVHALPLLHNLFETQCAAAAQEIHDTILALVDERLDAFLADVDPSRCGNPKAHSEQAVKILETAFRHAPNITQAEKYKLAQATGLQPRQVTIWFQNRRNRRYGARRAARRPSGRAMRRERAPPRLASVPPPRSETESVEETPIKSETGSPPCLPPASLSPELGVSSGLQGSPIKVEQSLPQLAAPGMEWTPSSPEHVLPMELTPAEPLAPASVLGLGTAHEAPEALSLDGLLDFDSAKQCLVFSPLDPLPRLDFADLRLDMESLERALGLGRTHPVLPPVVEVPLVPHDELAAAGSLVAQPMHVADEILAYAQAEGWALGDLVAPMRAAPAFHPASEIDRFAVHLDGVLQPAERALRSDPTTAPATAAPKWLSLSAMRDTLSADVPLALHDVAM